MKLSFTALLVLVLSFSGAAFADPLQAADHTVNLHVGGYDRSYLLHVPKTADSAPLPIVMMLHGAGGGSMGAARSYGWIEKSDSEKFLAVFPQGTPVQENLPANLLVNPRVWNDHRPERLSHPQPDDVAFLGAVLDDVEHKCNVDSNRIYVTGFSNGASMTFFLGTQLSNRIAAIAPVSGHCFLDQAKLSHPLPLMLIVGTADPLNPLNGGLAKNPWGSTTTKPSMFESVSDWLRFDGEPDAKSITEKHDDVTTQTFAAQTSCPVIFITIDGQGHEWPGKRRTLPKAITGNSNTTFDATSAIWNFFKDKTLPPPKP